MSISTDIPYVWDDAIEEDGVTWSSPINYILTQGGTINELDTTYLNDLCVLRYGTTMHPLCYQCEVNMSKDMNYTSLSSAFHSMSNGSFGVMLVIGNTSGGAVNDDPFFEIHGRWKKQNLDTGAVEQGDAGLSYIPNGRAAIGNLDLAHFALVPTITALDNQGNIRCAGVSLKEYREQWAASAPNITEIGYQIYYKPQLNSLYYTSTDIRLVGTIIKASGAHYEMVNDSYNHVLTDVTTTRFAYIGQLYSAVRLDIDTITVPVFGATMDVASVIGYPYGTSSTHAPSVQKMVITDEYMGTPIAAIGCITYGTAMSIINSVGLWVCDDPATIENMCGNNTTDPGVYAPVINSQGVPTGAIQGGGSTPGQSPINQNWNNISLWKNYFKF